MPKYVGQTAHYQRIHAKVALRLWGDTPIFIRECIAADSESPEGIWFSRRVAAAAQRIYEDPLHPENSVASWRKDTDTERLNAFGEAYASLT